MNFKLYNYSDPSVAVYTTTNGKDYTVEIHNLIALTNGDYAIDSAVNYKWRLSLSDIISAFYSVDPVSQNTRLVFD